ncbi:hypothetical protein N2W54_004847 [Lotmaria passim]
MGFKTFLQGLFFASCAGVGGGVLSIRSKISDIEPLTNDEACDLRNASSLTMLAPHDQPTHRRVYAYRLDGLMPSKHAAEQVHSKHLFRQRTSDASATSNQSDTKDHPHPLSPSFGSLYALHAIEAAFPFRWGWMLQTFRDTYRVSDTYNVWWRTRPAWMSGMYAMLAETPDTQQREALIHDAAEEVERMSFVRYEALLESGDTHGAVIRGGQRPVTVTQPSAKEGGGPAETITTEMTNVAPIYGVRFDLPSVPDKAEQEHPHPRSAPLYVLYVSAPYNSDNPTSTWEQVRMWKDGWYSRWFAAHVVKALSEM